MVKAILDYRNAVAARDVFAMPDRSRAFEVLRDNPALPEILARMNRAQRGLPLDATSLEAEGMAVARAYSTAPEEPEAEEEQV